MQGQADRDSRLALGRAYSRWASSRGSSTRSRRHRRSTERAVDLFEALSREDPADTEPRHVLARSLQSLALVLSASGGDVRPTRRWNDQGRSSARWPRPIRPTRKRQTEWGRSEILYRDVPPRPRPHTTRRWRRSSAALTILEAPAGAGPPSQDLQPELPEAYGALADVLDEAGRRDEALVAYAKARDWAKRCSWRTPTTPPSATSWSGTSAIWGSVSGTPAAGTRRSWPSTGRGRCSRWRGCQPDSHYVPCSLGLDRYRGRRGPRRAGTR